MIFIRTLITLNLIVFTYGQCPWPKSDSQLQSDCSCEYKNPKKLTIQCSPVNFTHLIETLHSHVNNTIIELLQINNGTSLNTLNESIFKGLQILNLQITKSDLQIIHLNAFNGLNNTLQRLTLSDNQLSQVPTESLSYLKSLRELDLTANQITSLPDNCFKSLRLLTLKLADNSLINISKSAFNGLENYLNNLNLKGTTLTKIPEAIQNLTTLAFLDLAQNQIHQLEPHQFRNLHKLTALSLERNKIKTVNEQAFQGINDSLSSLSMLNNLLVDFPTQAMSSLTELRVLDIGFNGIETIPENAFDKNSLLTLLALDGNPISTLSAATFKHLKTTLRGLSVGGKELVCNCSISWIIEWMKEDQLQVTSRERNPQFCGKPDNLKRRSLYELSIKDLGCEEVTSTPMIVLASSSTTIKSNINKSTSKPSIIMGGHSSQAKTSRRLPSDWDTRPNKPQTISNDQSDSFDFATEMSEMKGLSAGNPLDATMNDSGGILSHNSTVGKGQSEDSLSSASMFPEITVNAIKIMNAYQRESSVIIEWDSQSNDNGRDLQIVYRFFGRKEFKKGPKLRKSSRRYALNNLPANECIVVCAVSTSVDIKTLNPDNVPTTSCREVRRERASIADLDKVVIGAVIALCAFVVIAILMLSCCYCKDGKKKSLPSLPPPPAAIVAVGGVPMKPDNEWETVSMYSSRSIPRARMYHMDGASGTGMASMLNGSIHNLTMDDTRSHLSNYSHLPNGAYGKRNVPGSAINGNDGQSHRPYSQLSNRISANLTLPHPNMNKASPMSHSRGSHHQLHHLPSNGNLRHHPNNSGAYITDLAGYQENKNKRSKSFNRLHSSSSMHSLTEYDSDQWHNGVHNGRHKMFGWK